MTHHDTVEGLDDRALATTIARAVARLGGSTYYVGGCVRDRILGRTAKDLDIEVHGIEAEDLRSLLAGLGEVKAVGASFGIYNLKGHDLDIALPRRADAGPGGCDRIEEVADPHAGTYQAARRRDLTMNALYEDVLTGEVIDHFGGVDDLRHHVIRHVDDQTFSEDPLRVLRAAQFAARLDMDVAPQTLALAARIDLTALPCERVLEELRKALMASHHPAAFFETLRGAHQLRPWFDEVAALVGVEQNPVWHPEGDVWVHTMLVLDAAASVRADAREPFALMLSALCHDLGKASATTTHEGRVVSYGHELAGLPRARALLARLGAATRTKAYVLNMVELHMAPLSLVAQRASDKAYMRLFDRSCCPHDLLLLARADSLGRGSGHEDSAFDELEGRLQDFEDLMARPHVQGADLIEIGMEPGPALGAMLEFAHKLRLSGLSKEDQLRQCRGQLRHEAEVARRKAR